jgi:hypothetical protein
MDLWDYKRFLHDRVLLACLGISLLLVTEFLVKPERFPYARTAVVMTTKINQAITHLAKQIDRLQIPEKEEDKLVQHDSDSYCGDFDFPAQH